ncbi:MAG: hypothetical protein ACI4TX_05100 [Christensenellales bacterium]
MNKEEKKEVKQLIKEIRQHYVNKYNAVVGYLIVNEEELQEHIADIRLLLTNEKYYHDEIEAIKLNLELHEQEERYKEQVDSKVTAQEYMLAYLEEQETLTEEEYQRNANKKETRASEIKKKQKRLDKLQTRLDNLQKCKEKVQELIQELQPEKRKVGRPKKVKIEENNSL